MSAVRICPDEALSEGFSANGETRAKLSQAAQPNSPSSARLRGFHGVRSNPTTNATADALVYAPTLGIPLSDNRLTEAKDSTMKTFAPTTELRGKTRGVYRWLHIPTGFYYFGESESCETRIRSHWAMDNDQNNEGLRALIAEHPIPDEWEVTIWPAPPWVCTEAMEKAAIAHAGGHKHPLCLNKTPGGRGYTGEKEPEHLEGMREGVQKAWDEHRDEIVEKARATRDAPKDGSVPLPYTTWRNQMMKQGRWPFRGDRTGLYTRNYPSYTKRLKSAAKISPNGLDKSLGVPETLGN